MKTKALLELIIFLLILLFVYAASSKLLDFPKFEVQVSQSPLLTPIAAIVAWSIPIVELIVSMLLAIPRSRAMGLYGAFTLMVMFTAYIAAILQMDDNIPCSCGGVLEKMGWTEHLIFNIAFLVLALTGIILETKVHDSKVENLRAK